VIYVSGGC